MWGHNTPVRLAVAAAVLVLALQIASAGYPRPHRRSYPHPHYHAPVTPPFRCAATANLSQICTTSNTTTVQEVCTKFGLCSNNVSSCSAMLLLERLAAAFSSPICRNSTNGGVVAPPSVDTHGTLLPADLVDVRELPAPYPYAEVRLLPPELPTLPFMANEGGTYFWYYRLLLNLGNWAPCPFVPNNTVKFPVPAGWDMIGYFDLPQLPFNNTPLPYAALLKIDPPLRYGVRRESCEDYYHRYAASMRAGHVRVVHSHQHSDRYASFASSGMEHGDTMGGYEKEPVYRTPNNRYRHAPEADKENYGDDDARQGQDPDSGYDGEDEYPYGAEPPPPLHNRWESSDYDPAFNCHDPAPNLVLLLRRSLSPAEWALGLDYSQTQDASYGPGAFHNGAWRAAETIWNGGLSSAILQQINDGARSVAIAGHSFGAAVGQLLAVRIEELFRQTALNQGYSLSGKEGGDQESARAPVTMIGFGAPNVGDAEWTGHFNAKINARNIEFTADLMPQLPCTPQVVACPSPPVNVSTANPPSNVWRYRRTGGNILVTGINMPFNGANNSWAQLDYGLNGTQICDSNSTKAYFQDTHLCSYLCMSSGYVDSRGNNLCWINGQTTPAAGASRCSP